MAATCAEAATNGLVVFETTIGGQAIKTIDPASGFGSNSTLSLTPLLVPGIPIGQDSANAAWSPQGTDMAYSSAVGGRPDVYVVSANVGVEGGTTTPQRITRDPVAAIDPTWSPDGRQIAFTSLRDGNPEIYVVDVLDGTLQRLTSDTAADGQADWSPGGALIAFQSDRAGSEDIWLMRRDGTEQRALTNAPGEESDAEFKRDDGARIAYSSGVAGAGVREILSIPTTGGPASQLTRSGRRNAFPAWSPDGEEIAYSSDENLYVLPAAGVTDTSSGRFVTGGATDPDWSILPLPQATARGDVTVKRPREATAGTVQSGETVMLATGTVVDTSGGGTLTLVYNRPAVAATSPDSTATITDAVVQVTERTSESLGLRIKRPDCPGAAVTAARSKPKKARVTTKTTEGKGKKKAQVKPSTPEGSMSSPLTDYDVIVTCNGTYVRVRDGVVLVQPAGRRSTLRARPGRPVFLARSR